jgi:hypothetical protein
VRTARKDADHPPRRQRRRDVVTLHEGLAIDARNPLIFLDSITTTTNGACDVADASVTVRAMQKFRRSISGSKLIVARLATNAFSR